MLGTLVQLLLSFEEVDLVEQSRHLGGAGAVRRVRLEPLVEVGGDGLDGSNLVLERRPSASDAALGSFLWLDCLVTRF